MAEKKHCIRCERPIDAYARICPYCNWDQSDSAVPPAQHSPEQQAAYVAPEERNLRRYGFMAAGAVLLLIVSFALGSLVHGRNPPKSPKEAETEQHAADAAKPIQHADVTLVPVSGNDVGVEAPITSAPVATPSEGVPAEYQRSDATAVSSVEYAQLAQLAAREQAEKKKPKSTVDPRTLTGPAYAQAPQRQDPPAQMSSSSTEPARSGEPQTKQPEPARVVITTRPVPEYQPIPDISVSETTVVRLQLTIGADGHVKEVNVLQGIPGQTAKIIAAVQSWRFKPGTENGTPVAAPFSVDLSFRGNE